MKWAFWRTKKRRAAESGRTDAKSGTRSEFTGADDAALHAEQAARIRVRMRRRLIGSAALLLGGAVLVPMMLDPTPRPLPDNIPIDIPSERTAFAPRLALPAEPKAPDGKPAEGKSADSGAAAHGATEGVDEPPAAAEPAVPAAPAPDQKSSAKPPAATAPAPAAAATPPESGRWFVQAAALSSDSAARQLSGRLTKAGLTPFVERVQSGSSVLYRVRLGPYASHDEAVKARKHLHAMGVGSNVVRSEQSER